MIMVRDAMVDLWAGIVFGSPRFGKVIQGVGHIGASVALGAIACVAPLVEFYGFM
jgi:hypothetical protein